MGGIWEIVFSWAGPVRKGASRVSRSGTLECGSMAARSRGFLPSGLKVCGQLVAHPL